MNQPRIPLRSRIIRSGQFYLRSSLWRAVPGRILMFIQNSAWIISYASSNAPTWMLTIPGKLQKNYHSLLPISWKYIFLRTFNLYRVKRILINEKKNIMILIKCKRKDDKVNFQRTKIFVLNFQFFLRPIFHSTI